VTRTEVAKDRSGCAHRSENEVTMDRSGAGPILGTVSHKEKALTGIDRNPTSHMLQ